MGILYKLQTKIFIYPYNVSIHWAISYIAVPPIHKIISIQIYSKLDNDSVYLNSHPKIEPFTFG